MDEVLPSDISQDRSLYLFGCFTPFISDSGMARMSSSSERG
jgi:hypothetical protein